MSLSLSVCLSLSFTPWSRYLWLAIHVSAGSDVLNAVHVRVAELRAELVELPDHPRARYPRDGQHAVHRRRGEGGEHVELLLRVVVSSSSGVPRTGAV